MVKGSCLCGGVAFEIEGELTPIQFCHAKRCQKFTGSAFSPELATKRDALRWTRGEDLITIYDAPLLREPPPLRRAFCRVCGSPLPAAPEGKDFVVILAGVLDDDPGTKPFRHIFLDDRPAWDEEPEEMQRFGERPPPHERSTRSRRD